MKKITPPYRSLFFVCLLLTLLSGCQDGKKVADEKTLKGYYVNQSYLEQVPDSIPGLINAYCYAMNFVNADFVEVNYGFEEATLPYTSSNGNYVIKKALKDKDLFFTVSEDQTITLVDSTWNESAKNSLFKKASDSVSQKSNFDTFLNEAMIVGTYTLFDKDKATGQKVTFSANGNVKGLADFATYDVCFSGDCVAEVYPISNNITFHNASSKSTTFAFRFDRKEKTLNLYYIENPIPDIKGERAIKSKAFDLRY